MKKYAVAIDGPSGAGKSSIAKLLAKKLNIVYVDTGAIYRTVGLYVFRQGIESKDAERIIALLPQITVKIQYENGEQHIYLNGEDVSNKIRNETISKYASDVSAIPEVRAFLLSLQRDIAAETTVVMDGRDIGTVVLPNAEVKIFLTASAEVRAMRRYKEHIAKGLDVSYDEVLKAIITRDKNDSTRKTAPLKPAEDSVLLDNSELDAESTLQAVIKIIESRI